MKGKLSQILLSGLWAACSALLICAQAEAQIDSIVRVSKPTYGGGGAGNGGGIYGDQTELRVSADGRYSAFESTNTELVENDLNGATDVFRYDKSANQLIRVSITDGEAELNHSSHLLSISADGNNILFWTEATNLPGAGHPGQLYVRNVQAGTTSLVSKPSGASSVLDRTCAQEGAISGNGRFVVFQTRATNAASDTPSESTNCYVHDRESDTTSLISKNESGVAIASGCTDNGYGRGKRNLAISYDGSVIAFVSGNSNLVAGDFNDAVDLFVVNRTNPMARRVNLRAGDAESTGQQFQRGVDDLSFSSDARYVFFTSDAENLDPSNPTGIWQAYRRDLIGSEGTVLVSRDTSGAISSSDVKWLSASFDGRYIAFQTDAANFSDSASSYDTDVIVRDIDLNKNFIVSRDSTNSLVNGNGFSHEGATPSISGDGNYVIFYSADDLTGEQSASQQDAYLVKVRYTNPASPVPTIKTARFIKKGKLQTKVSGLTSGCSLKVMWGKKSDNLNKQLFSVNLKKNGTFTKTSSLKAAGSKRVFLQATQTCSGSTSSVSAVKSVKVPK